MYTPWLNLLCYFVLIAFQSLRPIDVSWRSVEQAVADAGVWYLVVAVGTVCGRTRSRGRSRQGAGCSSADLFLQVSASEAVVFIAIGNCSQADRLSLRHQV